MSVSLVEQRNISKKAATLFLIALTVAALYFVVFPTLHAHASGVGYSVGDVFAGVGNGQIKHFSPTGTLLDTLDTTSGSSEDTGMCFDSAGNLRSTNFESGTMSEFDNKGNLTKYPWGGPFSVNPESCVVDAAGNIYVGEVDGQNLISKFAPDGTLLATYAAATEDRGTDWIDLASDQCTIYYTSEGMSVKRFNVCTNTQLPDFATGLSAPCFALRIRSNGEVMVTCQTQSYRLSATGSILTTYPIANEYLFALNLDPDGTHFWVGGIFTGNVYKVDIATGAGTSAFAFNTGPLVDMAGLAIFGEPTVANPPGVSGYMYGIGNQVTNTNEIHGFNIHCGVSQKPSTLTVSWGTNRFILQSLSSATCTNDPNLPPNNAKFNTVTGSGTGTYNKVPGATVTFTFTDTGDTNDSATITIKDAGGNTVLSVSGPLVTGDQDAHKPQ